MNTFHDLAGPARFIVMKQILSPVLVVVVFLIDLHVNHYPTTSLGPLTVADTDDDFKRLITTSELIVGQNRFAFGFIKGNNFWRVPLPEFGFIRSMDRKPRFVAESNAPYRIIGSVSGVDNAHRHEDGTTD